MRIEKALITGASAGIGEALAKLLASKGIHLILTGRDASRLENVAKETQAKKTILGDLADQKVRLQIIEAIQLDMPDLVVNNAGFAIYGDVLSKPFEAQKAVAEVNALAPLEITIKAAQVLIAAKKRGVVLNVSSAAGEHPAPGMCVYGASKSFLTMFSRAFHQEVAPQGIDVLVACPGMVSTDFASRAAQKKVSVSGPVLSPEFAASEIWKQIEKRKPKWIFSSYYRWSLWFAERFAPETVIMKLVWKRIKDRL